MEIQVIPPARKTRYKDLEPGDLFAWKGDDSVYCFGGDGFFVIQSAGNPAFRWSPRYNGGIPEALIDYLGRLKVTR